MALRKFLFANTVEGYSETHTAGADVDQLDMGTSRIVNMANPTAPQDAATKFYVDSVASGLDVKASVRVLPTADFSSYTPAGSGVAATLTAPTDAASHNTQDGVLLAVSDRVLVATVGGVITTPDPDNGIYTVFSLGNGAGTSFVLIRATDFDQDAEVTAGAFTFVEEGTANADTG